MTKAEIDALKARAGQARSATASLSSMLSHLQSEPVNRHLTIVGDFLRNVENVLIAAGDVTGVAPDPG